MNKVARRIVIIGFLTVVAFVAVSGVRITWTPAPAIVSSVALSGASTGTVFESDIIEVDATLAGLSWRGRPPEAVWVRVSETGTEWSEWIPLGIHAEHAPDPGSEEAAGTKPATDPAFFGPVSFLQYRLQDTSAEFTASAVGRFSAEIVETSGRGMGVSERVIRLFSSVEFGGGSEAVGAPGMPDIVRNEEWGGPQCLAGVQPRRLPRVHRTEVAIVHHAGNNLYASGQGARDLIFAICTYHVSTRGWWDIAYNFIVDRYGTIYEGRRGSIEYQIQGGHTAGFNSYSFGVAVLGNFEESHRDGGIPTPESVTALEQLLAWRLNVHHIPATGVVTLESLGSSKWLAGTPVTLNRISGHIDASKTACPGSHLNDRMSEIRANVALAGQPKFGVDFSDFDPLLPGTPGSLVLSAPLDAPWTVSAMQRLGSTVWSTSGVGPGVVAWDAPVTPGPYTIVIDFGVLGIHEQVIQVGSYDWPFVDDEGSFASSEIRSMWRRGITVGCDWNLFCPTGTLTRAEVATFVARSMDGEPRFPPFQGHYSDVGPGQWYTGAIEFLVAQGVLPGGGISFGVDEPATRAFVVDLVLAALGDSHFPPHQGHFSDVLAGAWYAPMVERAYELGIARGYPDGTFRPDGTLTRQEAVAFLMRALG